VPSRTVRRTDNGVLIQDTAVERDISSGFYVTPRVNGDTVMLDISTQRDTPATRLGAGAAHINLTVTSVSGRPGKWIEFSGINQSSGIEGGGTLSRSSSSGSMNQRVYLRVDEAR